jgi:class 3 adenylate cyclase
LLIPLALVFQYYLFANTVRDITKFRVENMVEALDSLGESITAHAIDQNLTFPFVTLPMFEVAGRHARRHSRMELLFYAPFVSGNDKTAWEEYSVANQGWIDESRTITLGNDETLQGTSYFDMDIPPLIFEFSAAGTYGISEPGRELYQPVWTASPPPFTTSLQNWNMLQVPNTIETLEAIEIMRGKFIHSQAQTLDVDRLVTGKLTFCLPIDSAFLPVETDAYAAPISGLFWSDEDHDAFHAQFVTSVGKETTGERPHASFATPVYENLGSRNSAIVGTIFGILAFDAFLADLLPDKIDGIYCVLQNSCDKPYTYELTGNRALYLGEGDLHDSVYQDLEVRIDFEAYRNMTLAVETEGHCMMSLHLYPGIKFINQYKKSLPIVFTLIVACTFLLMSATFFIYDRFVYRRNVKVVDAAVRSSTIVSSLFPSNVRKRIYEDAKVKKDAIDNQASHTRLKNFLNYGETKVETEPGNPNRTNAFESKPIAELFPNTTVMFGDISGFTAWSSSREPTQVFTLLETLYHSFDSIAKKRRVFKVETVGDCYVAVTGLPDPQKDHAVAMARFAVNCLHEMQNLTKSLELSLGPDTADLSLRIGLHSGPVTAGVLRGDRSRFQLFGDTMNVAARMESNGCPDRIHLSQETANLLIQAGKQRWLTPREHVIVAKGKGEMRTFWLSTAARSQGTSAADSTHNIEEGRGLHSSSSIIESCDTSEESKQQMMRLTSSKAARLIDWNVDALARLLQQLVNTRNTSGASPLTTEVLNFSVPRQPGATILDEVAETVQLPPFDESTATHPLDAETKSLDKDVLKQLHEFVSNIAAMYRNNSFHNFEHASHVLMSVAKLLSRIVAPTQNPARLDETESAIASRLQHDHTFGITSDPLTQFACVFSALIHDVDHPGIPNTELVTENTKLAALYGGKSVAEQNSVDLAWGLLSDDAFTALRQTICPTNNERDRFRQLVVNAVMATDVMDPDLGSLRNARWERAFTHSIREGDGVNRKATIVIEHLLQASDVAHTMQHWHVYRKWNERLFTEMYRAYEAGRSGSNPVTFWYTGELAFLDQYVLPLARKLKECGVFGVSSDECLNYAVRNRAEWERRGTEIVSRIQKKLAEETLGK